MSILSLSGIAVTNTINSLGGIRKVSGITKFEHDVKVLLETEKGTLIGDPEYGSNIFKFIFLPKSNSTATLIREEIKKVVEYYYQDTTVTNVDIIFDTNNIKLIVGYQFSESVQGNSIELNFSTKRSEIS